MNHIESFFSKLKSSFAGLANKKALIAAACLDKAGVKIAPEQIVISGQSVRLNTSAGAKSAIFMKKAEILGDLREKIKPAIIDIR